MIDQAQKLWDQREAQFGHMPGHILRDLARNDSTPHMWRKAVVQIMLDKGYPEAGHPELAKFVDEIREEQSARDEVIAIVESAIEGPLPDAHNLPQVIEAPPVPEVAEFVQQAYYAAEQVSGVPNPPQKSKSVKVSKQLKKAVAEVAPSAGPFAASVTTATMFGTEVVDNSVRKLDDDDPAE